MKSAVTGTYIFLPRDTMRKRGVCCRPVSFRPSQFVYCIQMAKDIVKLLSRPSSPIILVFDPMRDTQFQGNSFS